VAHGSLKVLAFAKKPGGDGADRCFIAIAEGGIRWRIRILLSLLRRALVKKRDDADSNPVDTLG
jgi:hypothetical protein